MDYPDVTAEELKLVLRFYFSFDEGEDFIIDHIVNDQEVLDDYSSRQMVYIYKVYHADFHGNHIVHSWRHRLGIRQLSDPYDRVKWMLHNYAHIERSLAMRIFYRVFLIMHSSDFDFEAIEAQAEIDDLVN